MSARPFEAGDRVRFLDGSLMADRTGTVEMAESPGWDRITVRMDDRPECPLFDTYPESLERIA